MLNFPGKNLVRRAALERVRRNLKCVFVLSTGRVGTDALTRLLDLSPEIHADHEPMPKMLRETKEAYQNPSADPQIAEEYLNLRYFNSPHTNPLRASYREGATYVETSNRLTYLAPALAAYFPQAKFIFMHRDPPSVVRSAMRRGYYNGHSWDPYRIEPRPGDDFYEEWNHWSAFQKCCWYWRSVNGFICEFIDAVPTARCFTFPFSGIASGDIHNIKRLFEWLEIQTPLEDAVRTVLSVRHNAQEQGDFPNWGEWTGDQRSELSRISGDVIERLGYQEFVVDRVGV